MFRSLMYTLSMENLILNTWNNLLSYIFNACNVSPNSVCIDLYLIFLGVPVIREEAEDEGES